LAERTIDTERKSQKKKSPEFRVKNQKRKGSEKNREALHGKKIEQINRDSHLEVF